MQTPHPKEAIPSRRGADGNLKPKRFIEGTDSLKDGNSHLGGNIAHQKSREKERVKKNLRPLITGKRHLHSKNRKREEKEIHLPKPSLRKNSFN